MKKVVLIFGVIIILVSCSTDDATYEQKSNNTNLFRENTSDFCITCRDSTDLTNEKENDSIFDEIDPVKPKKD